MNKIEKYRHEESGYNPYLIGPKWQVARLNYLPELNPNVIKKLDVHHEIGEAFLPVAGRAVLIAGEIKEEDVTFEVVNTKPGVLYNIPKGLWHDIAMSEDVEISITEDVNTHLSDFEYFYFEEELRNLINSVRRED